jgi:cyclophilin family peptidyl-prolyl cis-trans isomerase
MYGDKLRLAFTFSFIAFFALNSAELLAAKAKPVYLKISTGQGEIFIRLYDETPKHRDNFLKLVKDKQLNNTLFHRVIKDFMIQGGDPDSKTAGKGQMLGGGDLGYKVDAEFVDSLFHKRGALGAARDGNPQKASSASQFYIVQGKKYTDAELEALEQYRLEGRTIPAAQKQVYKTIGGTPFLDQSYTVFGEVVKGMEVVDKISQEKTDRYDRPEEDIKMQVQLLKKREVKKLLKALKAN